MISVCDLTQKQSSKGSVVSLTQSDVEARLETLTGWQQYDHLISKKFLFKDYYQTMAFVNAVAWVSHCKDHHPELFVTFNSCRIEYTTHAIHGLSENDFICAAQVEALFKS